MAGYCAGACVPSIWWDETVNPDFYDEHQYHYLPHLQCHDFDYEQCEAAQWCGCYWEEGCSSHGDCSSVTLPWDSFHDYGFSFEGGTVPGYCSSDGHCKPCTSYCETCDSYDGQCVRQCLAYNSCNDWSPNWGGNPMGVCDGSGNQDNCAIGNNIQGHHNYLLYTKLKCPRYGQSESQPCECRNIGYYVGDSEFERGCTVANQHRGTTYSWQSGVFPLSNPATGIMNAIWPIFLTSEDPGDWGWPNAAQLQVCTTSTGENITPNHNTDRGRRCMCFKMDNPDMYSAYGDLPPIPGENYGASCSFLYQLIRPHGSPHDQSGVEGVGWLAPPPRTSPMTVWGIDNPIDNTWAYSYYQQTMESWQEGGQNFWPFWYGGGGTASGGYIPSEEAEQWAEAHPYGYYHPACKWHHGPCDFQTEDCWQHTQEETFDVNDDTGEPILIEGYGIDNCHDVECCPRGFVKDCRCNGVCVPISMIGNNDCNDPAVGSPYDLTCYPLEIYQDCEWCPSGMCPPGDVTGDGLVTVEDLVLIASWLDEAGSYALDEQTFFDIVPEGIIEQFQNADVGPPYGLINVIDVVMIVNILQSRGYRMSTPEGGKITEEWIRNVGIKQFPSYHRFKNFNKRKQKRSKRKGSLDRVKFK